MFHEIPQAVGRRMRALGRKLLAIEVDEWKASLARVDAMIVPAGKGELVCRRARAGG